MVEDNQLTITKKKKKRSSRSSSPNNKQQEELSKREKKEMKKRKKEQRQEKHTENDDDNNNDSNTDNSNVNIKNDDGCIQSISAINHADMKKDKKKKTKKSSKKKKSKDKETTTTKAKTRKKEYYKLLDKRRQENLIAEEKALEASLFGHLTADDDNDDNEATTTYDNHKSIHENDDDEDEDEDEPLFEVDRTGDRLPSDNESSDDDDDDNDTPPSKKNRPSSPPPIWNDDTTTNSINLSTTTRHRKYRHSPNETTISSSTFNSRLRTDFLSATNSALTDWATIPSQPTTTTTDIIAATPHSNTKPLHLPPHMLDIIRRPNLNLTSPPRSTATVVKFHPVAENDNRPIGFVTGFDQSLTFFKVGGRDGEEESEKLHGVKFPGLPITCADWVGGGSGSVVVSGQRGFWYVYDTSVGQIDKICSIHTKKETSLPLFRISPDGKMIAFSGANGYVILVDMATRQFIDDLKMNGNVRGLSFDEEGGGGGGGRLCLFVTCTDGVVYKWDVAERRCLYQFTNPDGMITTTLDSSPHHLAVGSESGVVELYDIQSQSAASPPRHLKSILNLTTPLTSLSFNHDGRILAMASWKEKNALRLLHVESRTVFSNWPTSKTPLDYVWSLGFSECGRYLGVGNDKGRCLLYNLKYYNEEQ